MNEYSFVCITQAESGQSGLNVDRSMMLPYHKTESDKREEISRWHREHTESKAAVNKPASPPAAREVQAKRPYGSLKVGMARICAYPECGKPFVARRTNHRFCTPLCSARRMRSEKRLLSEELNMCGTDEVHRQDVMDWDEPEITEPAPALQAVLKLEPPEPEVPVAEACPARVVLEFTPEEWDRVSRHAQTEKMEVPELAKLALVLISAK